MKKLNSFLLKVDCITLDYLRRHHMSKYFASSLQFQKFIQKFQFLKKNGFCFFFGRLFLLFFLATFSFQIKTLVFTKTFYLSGNLNYYSSFFLYLGDIFLILACFCIGIAFLRKEIDWNFQVGDKRFFLVLCSFLAIMLVKLSGSGVDLGQIFHTFRFFSFFLLYLFLINKILNTREILSAFLLGMMMQAFLAVFQSVFQSSLGFQFLGEPIANVHTLGVAKIDVMENKFLRSFGTFSHANVLGGAMAFSLVFLNLGKKFFQRNLFYFLEILFVLGLLLSFSRSAFLAFFLAGILCFILNFKQRRKVFSKSFYFGFILGFLFLVFSGIGKIFIERIFFDSSQAFSERLFYLDISQKMFFDHPFGVGFGQFTERMQDFTAQKIAPWIFQPVHNVFLLVFNELGIFGGVLFLLLWVYVFMNLFAKRKKLFPASQIRRTLLLISVGIIFVFISFFDHYFFSLYQGQVLMFFILAMIQRVET